MPFQITPFSHPLQFIGLAQQLTSPHAALRWGSTSLSAGQRTIRHKHAVLTYFELGLSDTRIQQLSRNFPARKTGIGRLLRWRASS